MGHEIAHAVAKHSVERASRGTLLNVGTRIIDIASGGVLSDINRTTGMNTVGLLAQLGILNPFNRKQESEADYLGMIFSSLSGYDAIPIIALTAHALAEHREQAEEAGANDFDTKPIEMPRLMEKIEKLLP